MESGSTKSKPSVSSTNAYTEQQVLSACEKLEKGRITEKNINAAIQGLNSPNQATARTCWQALSKIDPTQFKTEHMLYLIGSLKGDGGEKDTMLADLLSRMTMFTKVFTVDVSSPKTITKTVEKHSLSFKDYSNSSYAEEKEKLDKVAGLKNGEKLEMDMNVQGGSTEWGWGKPMVWERKDDQITLSFKNPSSAPFSRDFSVQCRDALIEKTWMSTVQNEEGFTLAPSKEDSPHVLLSRILFRCIKVNNSESASFTQSQTDKLFDILNSVPHVAGAGTFFSIITQDSSPPITHERYSSMISLISKGYSDFLDFPIQDFANAHADDGALNHNDIELFKKGLVDRNTADDYAMIYRHVGRHYAKLITQDDLQIFIDNIDQNKPEYCSGETCGCKARAIADLANTVPHLFSDENVNTVINTFNTSTTYRDGSAMILGYLSINEHERFGQKCIDALITDLNNPHEYDASILLLNSAIKLPEIHGEKVRDALLEGLGSQTGWQACLWALTILKEKNPGLFEGVDGEVKAKIDSIGEYSLSKQKELDILLQYSNFNDYFSMGWLSRPGEKISRLSEAITLEKEAKKKSQQ